MAPSISFHAPLSITHIGTATAIIHLDGVNLITDPVFSPAGTQWDLGFIQLKLSDTPALSLADLPPIDAVLLSHEDHADNLDEPGRRLLDGRQVLTTPDGAKNLTPRPGVRGLKPWYVFFLGLCLSHSRQITDRCKGKPSHLPWGLINSQLRELLVSISPVGKSPASS